MLFVCLTKNIDNYLISYFDGQLRLSVKWSSDLTEESLEYGDHNSSVITHIEKSVIYVGTIKLQKELQRIRTTPGPPP